MNVTKDSGVMALVENVRTLMNVEKRVVKMPTTAKPIASASTLLVPINVNAIRDLSTLIQHFASVSIQISS